MITRPLKNGLYVVAVTISLISCNNHINTVQYQSTIGPQIKTFQLPFKKAVYSISMDSEDNKWIGSREEGVCQVNNNKMNCFTDLDGLIDNQVRSIQEDEMGDIWLASSKGLTRYDGKKFVIQPDLDIIRHEGEVQTIWQELPNDLATLNGDSINILKYTSAQPAFLFPSNELGENNNNTNDLWFNAGTNSGAYKYDGSKLSYLPFPLPNNRNQDNNHYPTTLIHPGKNFTWFATYSGFFGYDGDQMMAVNDLSFDFDPDHQRFHIRSIFEDSKGNLWIGNNGLGVGVLMFDGLLFYSFTEQDGLTQIQGHDQFSVIPESDGLARVFSINEDKLGHIWFGTRDQGAWRYDGKELQQFTVSNGLSNNYIRVIYRDQKDQMWFGAGDGSVHRFNGQSFFKVY